MVQGVDMIQGVESVSSVQRAQSFEQVQSVTFNKQQLQEENKNAFNVTISNEKTQEAVTYDKTLRISRASPNEEASNNLQQLVVNLLTRQNATMDEVLDGKTVEVDKEARIEAKDLISEDGEFGVEKTSDRIFQFAIISAGNDKSKLDEIKTAIEEGFKMAEEVFGGELPEISSKTHDAIMNKLDSWAEEL